uniref:3-mercaptopyruvate sulfurtransferase-like n=1 Tax=Myxine glutinosa TaxID=7769 RepID=UPI00358F7FA3
MAATVRALVNGAWLAERLAVAKTAGQPRSGAQLRLIDTSWYLPKTGRNGRNEYRQQHIPGAWFFDLDVASSPDSEFDHMLPSAGHFTQYASQLGIGGDTHVVVYDGSTFGQYSAPRVWWMFRVFGHNRVSVLDGGLAAWTAQGFAVESGQEPPVLTTPEQPPFIAALQPDYVWDYEHVRKKLGQDDFLLMDARSEGRFKGTEPEPREGCPSGHIAGAISLPFTTMLDPQSKLLRQTDELDKVFSSRGLTRDTAPVAMCGSGVTACVLILAAHLCGRAFPPLYDGSWGEWARRAGPKMIVTEK